MSTIWKYDLHPGRNKLEMPEGAEMLTVQMQHGLPRLWALVWPGEPATKRVVDIYGTGDTLPPEPGRYVATFQMEHGALVWHVFDATGVA